MRQEGDGSSGIAPYVPTGDEGRREEEYNDVDDEGRGYHYRGGWRDPGDDDGRGEEGEDDDDDLLIPLDRDGREGVGGGDGGGYRRRIGPIKTYALDDRYDDDDDDTDDDGSDDDKSEGGGDGDGGGEYRVEGAGERRRVASFRGPEPGPGTGEGPLLLPLPR